MSPTMTFLAGTLTVLATVITGLLTYRSTRKQTEASAEAANIAAIQTTVKSLQEEIARLREDQHDRDVKAAQDYELIKRLRDEVFALSMSERKIRMQLAEFSAYVSRLHAGALALHTQLVESNIYPVSDVPSPPQFD